MTDRGFYGCLLAVSLAIVCYVVLIIIAPGKGLGCAGE